MSNAPAPTATCSECGAPLRGAPARSDGEYTTVGFLPCPQHPNARATPTPAGDSETFSQYVTRTKGREEAIRLTAIIDEQRRAFPDLMATTALVRAMADRLASPLRCPACDCRMFVGFHEHATEEDDGPICPVCKPAAATHYLNTP